MSPKTSDSKSKPARAVSNALNNVLVDGVDLYTQTKIAHWNIKGPNFAALHPLFDGFATDIARFNDEIAERSVTLGGLAIGTARRAARQSRLSDYPEDLTKDLAHVAELLSRFGDYLQGVKAARDVADEQEDQDTVDLLTEVVQVFEKHSWFLRATLGS